MVLSVVCCGAVFTCCTCRYISCITTHSGKTFSLGEPYGLLLVCLSNILDISHFNPAVEVLSICLSRVRLYRKSEMPGICAG